MYYIDNVNLSETNCCNDSVIISSIDFSKIGDKIVLQNIYFDFDTYEILEPSYSELNMLYNYLRQNKEY